MVNQLKRLRKRQHMTQEELGAKMPVTQATISSWERETHKPHRKYIPMLACVLEVTVEELGFNLDNTGMARGGRQMEINIGRKIQSLRKERGLAQVQLAKEASISRSYLACVEIGRCNPSVKMLKAIASVLDVPVSYLLEDTN